MTTKTPSPDDIRLAQYKGGIAKTSQRDVVSEYLKTKAMTIVRRNRARQPHTR